MAGTKTAPRSYLDRLLVKLDIIVQQCLALLDQSSIKNAIRTATPAAA